MIKIPHTLLQLDDKAEELYRELAVVFNFEKLIDARPADEATPVFNHLRPIIHKIITGQPIILEQIAIELRPLVANAKSAYSLNHKEAKKRAVEMWFKTEVLKIFNYDLNSQGFTKRDNGKMSYAHAIRLGMSTCPYCNEQFTFTISGKNKKTRPQFDHFFNKGKHPYFALSFYNLIPSCYVCNANLKGSAAFLPSTHLHPFLETIDEVVDFTTEIDTADYLVTKKDFTLTTKRCPGTSDELYAKAMSNIAAFAIEDRYNFHKDYAAEILTKAYMYDKTGIQALLEDFGIAGKQIFSSREEIIHIILGNYVQSGDLHKRILSKLTKDLAKEGGLIT